MMIKQKLRARSREEGADKIGTCPHFAYKLCFVEIRIHVFMLQYECTNKFKYYEWNNFYMRVQLIAYVRTSVIIHTIMPIILLFVFCIYHENCIQIHINILSFYLFCFGPSFAVARKHCVKLRACTRQRINWLGHETISKLSTLSIKIVKHQYFTGFNASNEAGTITSAKNKLYNTHTPSLFASVHFQLSFAALTLKTRF